MNHSAEETRRSFYLKHRSAQRLFAAMALVLGLPSCGGADNSPPTFSSAPVSASVSVAQPDSIVVRQELKSRVEPFEAMKSKKFAPGEARLQGPGFSFELAWATSGPKIDDGPRTTWLAQHQIKPQQAESGQELVGFAIAPSEHAGAAGEGVGASFELLVNGQAQPLIDLASFVRTGSTNAYYLVVVSVPVAAAVEIKANDQGRAQRIDVRTGKRTEAIDGYYPSRSVQFRYGREVPAAITVRGTSYAGNVTIVDRGILDTTARMATLLPWVPDLGWAPPGRIWLRMPNALLTTPLTATFPSLDLVVDEAAVFGVRLPTGQVARPVGATKHEYNTVLVETETRHVGSLTFNVPIDFTNGTYLVDFGAAPTLAVFRGGKLPAAWQLRPALEAPINIP